MKRTFAVILLIAMLLTTACTPKSQTDFETASACIGKTTSELLELIGRPTHVSYSSSCLGPGLDGELYYNSFIVYVYRDTDGTETVYDVMQKEAD